MQKSALGPGRTVSCQSGGKKLATRRAASFTAIPAFPGGHALLKSGSWLMGLVAVAGALLVMAVLQTFPAPLMRNET